MSATKDLTGQKFGLLVVIERAGSSPSGNALWRCVCSCPARNERVVKDPARAFTPSVCLAPVDALTPTGTVRRSVERMLRQYGAARY